MSKAACMENISSMESHVSKHDPASRSYNRYRTKPNNPHGRAGAQAFSRWFHTAAARVRVRAACGVCGGQSGTGAGLLRALRFPLTNIPPISPSS
jgi:hypothetical protein